MSSTEPVKCGVCGAQVYRNKRGQILAHTGRATVSDREGYSKRHRSWGHVLNIAICPGSTKGARP